MPAIQPEVSKVRTNTRVRDLDRNLLLGRQREYCPPDMMTILATVTSELQLLTPIPPRRRWTAH